MSGEERSETHAQRDMPQLVEEGRENGRTYCQMFRKTQEEFRDRGTGGCLLKCFLFPFPSGAGKKLFCKDSEERMSKSPGHKKAVQYVIHNLEHNSESCRALWDGFRHCRQCLQ